VPAEEFGPSVTAVLYQRLVRKLCNSCKEPYAPAPELLKRLGIPADRVEKLYRPPTPPQTEEEWAKHQACPECGDIGYKGRTAIFELLLVDKSIRETLVSQPKVDVLRKAARKAGNRSLQDEGILMVVRGVTSLAELSRVLKQ
jgi:type II secretory ATPase GspE/PulE/Tfp pilus assembly ATPase PilB-like protein